MQVSLTPFDEIGKELLGRSLSTSVFLFGSVSYRILDICFLVSREDIWHFTCIQDVVNVLEEAFLFYTIICEDESRCFTFSTDNPK